MAVKANQESALNLIRQIEHEMKDNSEMALPPD
jgi:hypothetical protein